MAVRWFRVAVVPLLAVLALVATSIGASADPGDLDASYGGGDGQVVTAFPDGPAYVQAAVLQSDGKLVVAGFVQRSTNDTVFALARYTASGVLDPSFGGDGRVETDFTAGADAARDVVIAKDGSITTAGDASGRIAAARYHPDGTLDHSFSGDGKVTLNVGTGIDVGYAIGRSKGGRVVIGGVEFPSVGNGGFALVRLNHDGTLDHSFGGDGKVTTDFAEGGLITDLLVGSGGAILAVGEGHSNDHLSMAEARYLPSGELDQAFGDGGTYLTDVGDGYFSSELVRLASGKYLVAGTVGTLPAEFDLGLVRLNANGKPDGTFGPNGLATQHFDKAFRSEGLARVAHGFVVSGLLGTGGTYHGAVVRLKGNGALDASFGDQGIFVSPSNDSEAADVVVRGNGRIVTGGNLNGEANSRFASFQLLPS